MPTQPFPSDNLDPLLATRGLLREGSAVVLPREGLGESERTEIFQRIIDRAQRSVAQRDQLAVELKHTMSRYDPVSVIGEIARDVHSGDPGEPDRAPAVFSWDAKLPDWPAREDRSPPRSQEASSTSQDEKSSLGKYKVDAGTGIVPPF